MKLRTQLVIASFLLSIVPLSAIVGYSYVSSRDAVEAAYKREAASLSKQMETRLAALRTDLEQRLAEVSALPLHDFGENTRSAVVRNVLAEMGDAASIVDSLEIQPFEQADQNRDEEDTPVPAAAAPAPHPKPNAKAMPAPQVARAEPPAPPPPREPIFIPIPASPVVARFTWSDEQKAQLKEITRLGMKLGNWQGLTPEDREETQKQLRMLQQAFDTSMRKSQAEFQKQIAASEQAREARDKEREARDERRAAAEEAKADADGNEEAAKVPAMVVAAPVARIPAQRVIRRLSVEERQKLRDRQKQATLLFGHRMDSPLRKQGEVVGKVSAQVSMPEVLKRVLGSGAERDEIAFAVDRDNNVYTRTPEDKTTRRASESSIAFGTSARSTTSRTGSSRSTSIRRAVCASAWPGRSAKPSRSCARPRRRISATAWGWSSWR